MESDPSSMLSDLFGCARHSSGDSEAGTAEQRLEGSTRSGCRTADLEVTGVNFSGRAQRRLARQAARARIPLVSRALVVDDLVDVEAISNEVLEADSEAARVSLPVSSDEEDELAVTAANVVAPPALRFPLSRVSRRDPRASRIRRPRVVEATEIYRAEGRAAHNQGSSASSSSAAPGPSFQGDGEDSTDTIPPILERQMGEEDSPGGSTPELPRSPPDSEFLEDVTTEHGRPLPPWFRVPARFVVPDTPLSAQAPSGFAGAGGTASMYIEPVRGGMEPRVCKVCHEEFAQGNLRLGYTPSGMTAENRPFSPVWIHAMMCARRARLHVSEEEQVGFSPTVSLADQRQVMEELSYLRPALARFGDLTFPPQQLCIRPWRYLPSLLQHWPLQRIRQRPSERPSEPPPTGWRLSDQQASSSDRGIPGGSQRGHSHLSETVSALPSARSDEWTEEVTDIGGMSEPDEEEDIEADPPQVVWPSEAPSRHVQQLLGQMLSSPFNAHRMLPSRSAHLFPPPPPPRYLGFSPMPPRLPPLQLTPSSMLDSRFLPSLPEEPTSSHATEVQSMLDEVPVFKLEKASTEPCVVCRDVMKPGELCRRLPCLHMFHQDCIDSWLAVKPSCPLDNLKLADMLMQQRSIEGVRAEGSPERRVSASRSRSRDRRRRQQSPPWARPQRWRRRVPSPPARERILSRASAPVASQDTEATPGPPPGAADPGSQVADLQAEILRHLSSVDESSRDGTALIGGGSSSSSSSSGSGPSGPASSWDQASQHRGSFGGPQTPQTLPLTPQTWSWALPAPRWVPPSMPCGPGWQVPLTPAFWPVQPLPQRRPSPYVPQTPNFNPRAFPQRCPVMPQAMSNLAGSWL